jgi:hypothetical protein
VQAVGPPHGERPRPVVAGLRGARESVRPVAGSIVTGPRRPRPAQAEGVGHPVHGESLIPDGELPADWREALAMIARYTRAALLRHPWAVQALQGGGAAGQDGAFGPNGIRHFEQSLAAVADAPLDTAAKLDLITLVDDYVFGHVLRAGEQQARSAGGDQEHAAEIAGYIQRQIATGQFPHLERLTHDPAAQTLADPGRLGERFERGLGALLDGAAADAARPGDQ